MIGCFPVEQVPWECEVSLGCADQTWSAFFGTFLFKQDLWFPRKTTPECELQTCVLFFGHLSLFVLV